MKLAAVFPVLELVAAAAFLGAGECGACACGVRASGGVRVDALGGVLAAGVRALPAPGAMVATAAEPGRGELVRASPMTVPDTASPASAADPISAAVRP